MKIKVYLSIGIIGIILILWAMGVFVIAIQSYVDGYFSENIPIFYKMSALLLFGGILAIIGFMNVLNLKEKEEKEAPHDQDKRKD